MKTSCFLNQHPVRDLAHCCVVFTSATADHRFYVLTLEKYFPEGSARVRVISLLQLILQPQLSAAVVSVKHRFSLSQIMIHVTRAALIAFERLLDFSSHTLGMAMVGDVYICFSQNFILHAPTEHPIKL